MAPGSPVIIDEALRKRRKKKIIVRSVFGSLTAVFALLVVLYFVLPVFWLSNSTFYGCCNFTSDDVLSLSGYSSSSSYLFVTDENLEKNIVENSNGLIREVESDVGFFTGEIFVREDYPVCYLASDDEKEVRYPSGRTYEEVLDAVDSLSLESDAVSNIRTGVENDYANSTLPLLYLPSGTDENTVLLAIDAIGDIPKNTINSTYALQFSSLSDAENFDTSLLDVLYYFEYDEVSYYIVLEDIPVSEIEIIFADDRILDEAIPQLKYSIVESENEPLNVGTYELSNPDLTLENVYHYRVGIVDDSTIEISRVNQ